jgi:uncharacterized protein involved in exopolysaccharide biosynthesis
MRWLFLFSFVAVNSFAQTTSDVSAQLQQAQSALENRRYDIAAPLLEKVIASNPPSIIAGVAQELRTKTYQDWHQWLQQSATTLSETVASNATAIAAAKEEARKAREAFNAESKKLGGFKKGGTAQMGKTGASLSDEMKAMAAADKQVSDLEQKQQPLISQLTVTQRYLAQVQARMTALNIKPKAPSPAPPPPPTPPPQ